MITNLSWHVRLQSLTIVVHLYAVMVGECEGVRSVWNPSLSNLKLTRRDLRSLALVSRHGPN